MNGEKEESEMLTNSHPTNIEKIPGFLVFSLTPKCFETLCKKTTKKKRKIEVGEEIKGFYEAENEKT